ncbi:isopentenyl pyrophosphate isomerase [Perkinsela sp. CCAP 1560/4]|nr:isopentenyl pyrophosphate isomerase [Perkinsela sp. CCAP 1560/4]|eukprot:KNH05277.1 isopentenyl pyrophosphate isomerase [Perkinsela sp. CCAP 1560/4]
MSATDTFNTEYHTAAVSVERSQTSSPDCVSLYIGNIPKGKNCTADILSILAPFVHQFYRIIFHTGHAFLHCQIKPGCTIDQLTTAGSGESIRDIDGTLSAIRVSVSNSPSRGSANQIEDKRSVYLYPIPPRTPREKIHRFILDQCNTEAVYIDRLDDCSCARVSFSSAEFASFVLSAVDGALFLQNKLIATHMPPTWSKHNTSHADRKPFEHKRPHDEQEYVERSTDRHEKALKSSKQIESFHISGFASPDYSYTNDILLLFEPYVRRFLKLRYRQVGYAFLDVELPESVDSKRVISHLHGRRFGPNKADTIQVHAAAPPSGGLLAEITHRGYIVYAYGISNSDRVVDWWAALKANGYTGSEPTVRFIKEHLCFELAFSSSTDAEEAEYQLNRKHLAKEVQSIVTQMNPGGYPYIPHKSRSSESAPHRSTSLAARQDVPNVNPVVAIKFAELSHEDYSFSADIIRVLQPYTLQFLKITRCLSTVIVEVVLNPGITEETVGAALRGMSLNEFQGKCDVSIEKSNSSSQYRDNETVLYLYPLHEKITLPDLHKFLSTHKCHPQHALIDIHQHCAVLVMHSLEDSSEAIQSLHGNFWSAIRNPVVCTHMHP